MPQTCNHGTRIIVDLTRGGRIRDLWHDTIKSTASRLMLVTEPAFEMSSSDQEHNPKSDMKIGIVLQVMHPDHVSGWPVRCR